MLKSLIPLFFTLFTTPLIAFQNTQDAYLAVTQASQNEQWDEVIFASEKLIHSDTSLGKEALYLRALAFFNLGDYTQANNTFAKYLKEQNDTQYFTTILEKKFEIAEAYRNGKGKRMFGVNKLPPIASGKEDALDIYDEIIRSMPHQEISAKSMYSKGLLLQKKKEYEESNEVFKELINSFPLHELACEAFVKVQWNYFHLASSITQDNDLIEMAHLNLDKLQKAFPGEKEKIAQAKKAWLQMQSVYAKGLFDIGAFYQRTKKGKAAALYYQKIIDTYPMTKWANQASKRLHYLEKKDLQES